MNPRQCLHLKIALRFVALQTWDEESEHYKPHILSVCDYVHWSTLSGKIVITLGYKRSRADNLWILVASNFCQDRGIPSLFLTACLDCQGPASSPEIRAQLHKAGADALPLPE